MLDGEQIGDEVRVIGFSRRVVANLLDGLLIVFATFLVIMGLSFLGIFVGMYRPEEEPPAAAIALISALVVSFVYYCGAWASTGQTLGHFMIGGRVTRLDGGKLSWGQAIVRYIGFIISGLALSLGFLWIVFDKKRQGWHDKLARTVVPFVDDEFPEGKPAEFTPADPGGGKGWIVVWLVLLLVAPAALLGSLAVLGPAIWRVVANFFR